MEDDLLGTVADAVHGSNPHHRVGCFQILCYTLGSLHLLDDQEQTLLCLLVQICQIGPELAAEDQTVKQDWVLLFEKLTVQSDPFPDRPMLFGQSQIGQKTVPNEGVSKPFSMIVFRMLFASFTTNSIIARLLCRKSVVKSGGQN